MGFRDARISAGLSVSQVMKNIGVSDAAVYQWETGVTRPNAKRLLEIARLYGVTVDDLLSEQTVDSADDWRITHNTLLQFGKNAA